MQFRLKHRVAMPCFDHLTKMNLVVKVACKTIKNWSRYLGYCAGWSRYWQTMKTQHLFTWTFHKLLNFVWKPLSQMFPDTIQILPHSFITSWHVFMSEWKFFWARNMHLRLILISQINSDTFKALHRHFLHQNILIISDVIKVYIKKIGW